MHIVVILKVPNSKYKINLAVLLSTCKKDRKAFEWNTSRSFSLLHVKLDLTTLK